mmetsp:Transcript_18363/g.52567  ORF Transcript_18363/g.52567 Transcript_18363/m.52567 type:complete len:407 (+) Transcript_18363:2414-3634(+)
MGACANVDRGEGVVHNDDLGPVHVRRASKSHPSALPAGEPDAVGTDHHHVGPGQGFEVGRQRGRMERLEVLFLVEGRLHHYILAQGAFEDPGHLRAEGELAGIRIRACDHGVFAGWEELAEQGLQERGLAGGDRTDNRHQLAAADGDIQVLECRRRVREEGEAAFDLQHRRALGIRGWRGRQHPRPLLLAQIPLDSRERIGEHYQLMDATMDHDDAEQHRPHQPLHDQYLHRRHRTLALHQVEQGQEHTAPRDRLSNGNDHAAGKHAALEEFQLRTPSGFQLLEHSSLQGEAFERPNVHDGLCEFLQPPVLEALLRPPEAEVHPHDGDREKRGRDAVQETHDASHVDSHYKHRELDHEHDRTDDDHKDRGQKPAPTFHDVSIVQLDDVRIHVPVWILLLGQLLFGS